MSEESKPTIAFCQWTYDKEFENTKLCIERVSPHVDHIIIVYNPISIVVDENKEDTESIQWLIDNELKYNLHWIVSEFKDNFPEQRNKYLERARELNVDWICVSDPDELFSEDLVKNLRNLIETYSKHEYSNLAIPCRDQFTAIEWLDNLDLLKECPMGYNETEYWKPMLIFKLFDDIHYEGVGIERNVHETLTTKYKLSTINLPKQYYYVHKKSSLKIWRNAARNMFLSGGGDNIGSKNRLWTELRMLCSTIGINTWDKFEKFIEEGIENYLERNYQAYDISEFDLWLEAALKAEPTKHGTETRETAKWYFALHPEKVTQRIKDLINKIPEIDKETEVENFVTEAYYKILGRHPDEAGKNHYSQAIIKKELKRSELIDILKKSEEYRERFGSKLVSSNESTYEILSDEIKFKYKKEDWDKVEKYVDKMYLKILGRQPDDVGKNYYIKSILEREIKSSDLINIFRNSDEYKNITRNSGILGMMKKPVPVQDKFNVNYTSNKFNLKFSKPNINQEHNTVALCIMGYSKGLPMIVESIMALGDEVNEIHIQGDDFTERDIKTLNSHSSKIQVHIEPWNDDFSDYKNKATKYANTEWIVILDHDEIPTQEFANELRNIIKSSDRGKNYDMVSFDVIDIRTSVSGNVISEVRNKGGKPLLHWNIPNPYTGNPHIWLKENYYPWKEIHSNVAYKHVKEEGTDLERSVRNIYMGGGGDNSKEKNSNWIELKNICKELNINTYKEFDSTLRKGNLHTNLLNVIKKLASMKWKDDELKDILKYYYILHPEEQNRITFGDNISWHHHVDEILEQNNWNEDKIYYKYDGNEIVRHLRKYINVNPKEGETEKKLLDCGCHIGRWSRFFSEMGFDYTGIDQSDYAIEIARKYNPTLNFKNFFLWDINFKEEFDIAITMAVLQHNKLEEQKKIINQIYNSLKPNGIFFMTESTTSEETETQHTYENWKKLIESFGFKFLNSWHPNEIGSHDFYIFKKELILKI